jgi:Protein of unknown function (DUF2971).
MNFPEIIYHYCSTDTLLQIIKNKTLRLSDISKSNDAAEMNLIRKNFEIAFFNACQEISPNFIIDDAQKAHYYAAISWFKTAYSHPYVCCFSSQSDLLSQWRGYASDGAGVAIGFSSAPFMKESKAVLKKVEYSGGKQKIFVDELICELFDDGMPFNPNEEEQRERILECTMRLAFEAATFKDESFSEESEYRLVFDPQISPRNIELFFKEPSLQFNKMLDGLVDNPQLSNQLEMMPLNFLSSGNTIKSYFDLSFEKIKETVIKEIVIDPKCVLEMSDILLCLYANGYDMDSDAMKQINIIKSKSTYR